MDQLATIFNSLRQENGEPDDQARRSALDGLLQHLSLQEIRRIRVQLGSHPVCDICDFPLELVIRIFTYVPLEDVLILRGVSRKWYNVLSSPDFCHGMTKEHFRPYWDRRNKAIGAGLKQKYDETIKEWFQHAAIARIKRSHGHYHSMAIYWHHMSPGEAGQEPHFCAQSQYSNGRIGLKFDRNTIRVKNLRSNTEDQMFMDENREPFEKWLLSDKYLICLKASPTTLLAWALDSTDNAQPHRVRLPSKVLNLSANQNRVAVVTTGYEVYIWTVGGNLSPLKISMAKHKLEFTTTHLAVLWDPADYTHLFVVYEGFVNGKIIFVILQFFQFLQKVHVIEFVEYSSEGRRPPRIMTLQAGLIGIFNLSGLSHLDRNGKLLDVFSQDSEDMCMLVFDTYAGRFNINYYPIPDCIGEDVKTCWPHMVSQLHFWRDQVLFPIYGQQSHDLRPDDHSGNKRADEALLLSLSAYSADRKDPVQIPWYSQEQNGKDKITMVSDVSKDPPSSIVYFWEAGAKFAEAKKPHRGENRINYSRNVMGDDDFVVLCGHYGFVVWCFDKKVKLPTASRWSESDVPLWEEPGVPASVRAFHPLA